MVISYNTVEKVHKILARHLTQRQIRLILDDLTMVPGNHSFRDTIIRLQRYHAEWAAGKSDVAFQEEKEQGRPGA